MTAASPVAFSSLLDFSAPVDVEVVESTVNIFYGAANQDQVGAEVAGGRVNSTPVICSRGVVSTGCQLHCHSVPGFLKPGLFMRPHPTLKTLLWC
jgi:hypothetical protein